MLYRYKGLYKKFAHYKEKKKIKIKDNKLTNKKNFIVLTVFSIIICIFNFMQPVSALCLPEDDVCSPMLAGRCINGKLQICVCKSAVPIPPGPLSPSSLRCSNTGYECYVWFQRDTPCKEGTSSWGGFSGGEGGIIKENLVFMAYVERNNMKILTRVHKVERDLNILSMALYGPTKESNFQSSGLIGIVYGPQKAYEGIAFELPVTPSYEQCAKIPQICDENGFKMQIVEVFEFQDGNMKFQSGQRIINFYIKVVLTGTSPNTNGRTNSEQANGNTNTQTEISQLQTCESNQYTKLVCGPDKWYYKCDKPAACENLAVSSCISQGYSLKWTKTNTRCNTQSNSGNDAGSGCSTGSESSGGFGCGGTTPTGEENPSNTRENSNNPNQNSNNERDYRFPPQRRISSGGELADACANGDIDKIYQEATKAGIVITEQNRRELNIFT